MTDRADTTRTLALHAEEQASAAAVDVGRMGRTVARAKWQWGVLTFLVIVAGTGYALRDQVEHFATKETVAANTSEIERQREQIQELNAVLRGVVDTQKRTLDGVDEVKRILMDRRHR